MQLLLLQGLNEKEKFMKKNKNLQLIISKNMRFLRDYFDYRQVDMAKQCNVSVVEIVKLENPDKSSGSIKTNTLEAIAKGLKIEPYLLMYPYLSEELLELHFQNKKESAENYIKILDVLNNYHGDK